MEYMYALFSDFPYTDKPLYIRLFPLCEQWTTESDGADVIVAAAVACRSRCRYAILCTQI